VRVDFLASDKGDAVAAVGAWRLRKLRFFTHRKTFVYDGLLGSSPSVGRVIKDLF
jgi:hypothetical protein